MICKFLGHGPLPTDVNMAQDSDVPTSADKGKGKATEKSKDDKPVLNGKKEDADKNDGMATTICRFSLTY